MLVKCHCLLEDVILTTCVCVCTDKSLSLSLSVYMHWGVYRGTRRAGDSAKDRQLWNGSSRHQGVTDVTYDSTKRGIDTLKKKVNTFGRQKPCRNMSDLSVMQQTHYDGGNHKVWKGLEWATSVSGEDCTQTRVVIINLNRLELEAVWSQRCWSVCLIWNKQKL